MGASAVIVLFGICLVFAQSGFAQNVWEIEGHGGYVMLNPSVDSDLRVPPPTGRTFTTGNGATSRFVQSWYFGDGPVLMNQVAGQLSLSNTMIPVDSSLMASSVSRGGVLGGVRISRRIASRYAGEISVDYDHNAIRLRRSTRSAIDASVNRFVTAWEDLFDSHSITADVTSSRSSGNSGGRSVAVSGTVNVDLPLISQLQPYVALGAGYAFDRDRFTLELSGSYQFTALTVPINERTFTTVHYASRGGFMGVLGGGFKHDVSSGWGIRGDLRVHIQRDRVTTTVESMNSFTPGSPGAGIFFAANPTIQFRSTSGVAGSLDTSPFPAANVSEGSGVSATLRGTIGVYHRF